MLAGTKLGLIHKSKRLMDACMMLLVRKFIEPGEHQQVLIACQDTISREQLRDGRSQSHAGRVLPDGPDQSLPHVPFRLWVAITS